MGRPGRADPLVRVASPERLHMQQLHTSQPASGTVPLGLPVWIPMARSHAVLTACLVTAEPLPPDIVEAQLPGEQAAIREP